MHTPINRFRLHCNVCLGACLFVLYCTDCIFVLAQFITPVILQWKYHRHTVVDLLERYIHSLMMMILMSFICHIQLQIVHNKFENACIGLWIIFYYYQSKCQVKFFKQGSSLVLFSFLVQKWKDKMDKKIIIMIFLFFILIFRSLSHPE